MQGSTLSIREAVLQFGFTEGSCRQSEVRPVAFPFLALASAASCRGPASLRCKDHSMSHTRSRRPQGALMSALGDRAPDSQQQVQKVDVV